MLNQLERDFQRDGSSEDGIVRAVMAARAVRTLRIVGTDAVAASL